MVEPAKEAVTADEVAEELRAAKAEKEAERAQRVFGDLPEEKRLEPEPPIELLTYKDRGHWFKPTIELHGKGSPTFYNTVSVTLAHLKDSPAEIYQRGGMLVRKVQEWGKGVKGERVLFWKLTEMTEKSLEIEMMKHIHWEKKVTKKKKSGEPVVTDAETNPIGSQIAAYGLQMRSDWKFNHVDGLISAPTLRPDGSLLSKLGYDQKTGLLLINSPEVSIKEAPSREDAEANLLPDPEASREQFATCRQPHGNREGPTFLSVSVGRRESREVLIDPFLAAQLSNAVLAAQAFQQMF